MNHVIWTSSLVRVSISISLKSQQRVGPPFIARHARQSRLVLLMSRPVVGCGIRRHSSWSTSASSFMSCGLCGHLRTHLPRMSHECSTGDRSEDFAGRGCLTNVQLETGLKISLAEAESWFWKTAGDLGQQEHDGLLHCRLERCSHSHADRRKVQR